MLNITSGSYRLPTVSAISTNF